MNERQYFPLDLQPSRYFRGLILLLVPVVVGLMAAYHMEHQGHYVTGMSNQVVWGLPHVFAIFLILVVITYFQFRYTNMLEEVSENV